MLVFQDLNKGRIYVIKNISQDGDIGLHVQNSGLIEGQASYTITNDYPTVTVQSDGSKWYIIGHR